MSQRLRAHYYKKNPKLFLYGMEVQEQKNTWNDQTRRIQEKERTAKEIDKKLYKERMEYDITEEFQLNLFKMECKKQKEQSMK